MLGNINYYDGLNSFVFEIDPNFSTHFDYKGGKNHRQRTNLRTPCLDAIHNENWH